MSKTSVFALVVVCCLPAGLAAEDRLTVWLTLDAAKIGPVVSCDGEFQLSGGGRIDLRKWMTEEKDRVEGAGFQLTTGHNRESAAAANVLRVRRSTLPKGLLLEIDARSQSLIAKTKLGDFEVSLDRLRNQRDVTVLDGKIRLQVIPNVDQLTGDKAEEEFPSMALMPDGRTAVAYVAWDGKSDRVLLRIGDQVTELTEKPGDYMDPRCAVDASGRLWVVWAANDGRQWDLWARSDGKPVKLTTNTQNDFWPRLAADRAGNLWLTWQAVADDLHYEVMLAKLGPGGLAEPVNVSLHQADDWEPAICTTPDGRLVLAWDSYRNGSYDVYLREFAPEGDSLKPLGPPLPVAATAEREAHATLAADSQGRVWLAWDVSMEDWGKHPKVAGNLHAYRHAKVACYAGGKIERPAAALMESLPKPFGKFVEYPQIAVDGRDRVWVVWRASNEVRIVYYSPQLSSGGQNWAIWHLFASQYDGQQWSPPVMLSQSNGRQDMRVDVATDASGELAVVYGADARTRLFPYQPVDYDVMLTSLAGFGVPMRNLELAEADDLGRIAPVNPDPELFPLPRKWTVDGKTYCLVVGDTHRHTDMSRCANGYDGSLQDAYRYALNAVELDWLAIADHDQDILKHRNDRIQRPRQDYDWWRSQKYCDLYTIWGRFLAPYAYEHGGSYKARGGHKNVILARRGFPVIEVDAPPELFAALTGSGAIVIPHQLADGGSRTDWEKWSPQYERVAEIFQTRGSYEYGDCPRLARIFTPGHSIWDALANDVRIGIVASSDHGQTHQARACLFVEDVPNASGEVVDAKGFTREGIIDALRARRTFGSTTAVSMQVSVNDRPLGEEITVNTVPTIKANVVSPAPITALAVVRDARFIYTIEPKDAQAGFEFQDLDLKPGQSSYYYIRALIGENDVAWSSPVWVTREE